MTDLWFVAFHRIIQDLYNQLEHSESIRSFPAHRCGVKPRISELRYQQGCTSLSTGANGKGEAQLLTNVPLHANLLQCMLCVYAGVYKGSHLRAITHHGDADLL